MGGKKLLLETDPYGVTVLYKACCNGNTLMDVISNMLEVGIRELVMMKSEDGTALHNACDNNRNPQQT